MKDVIVSEHKLFIVSGLSGSGKTSIMELVADHHPLLKVPTCTSRLPRENEIDGIDYFFKKEDFFFDNPSIIAPTNYSGNHYGIDGSLISSKLETSPCYIIVDQSGMYELKKRFKNSYSILIDADLEIANSRILSRERNESICKKRISTNNNEHFIREDFDFVAKNNNSFEECISSILNIFTLIS